MTSKRIAYGILIFSMLVLSAPAASKQTNKPNFSGTWKFMPEKSKLQIPPPASGVFRVDHREPNWHMSRTFVDKDGKSDTLDIDLTTDGKEVVQQLNNQTVRGRLYWEGNDLVFDSKIIMGNREAANVVKYHLSEDGKIFTANESFRGPRLKYDNIWVLGKE